jgi:pyruvate dehydrogenase E2 component (dihydrolipoamide acetyltransferase)
VPARREGGFTDLPNSNIRRITAQRLLESKQTVPHYYLTVSTRVDKLMTLRKQINEALAASGGAKLSINDFVVKASALALRDVPEVNSAWMGDFIRQYHSVDVSVAVQTPSGLMVPVIRNTDGLGLQDINAAVKALAGKAKEGKLSPDEMTGGTFTISNLGMFGVDDFAAIINPPQAAILAVGGTIQRVVAAPGGGFETGQYMNVTMSCDHRVVDGALGAQWLQAFKKYIEDPLNMLV